MIVRVNRNPAYDVTYEAASTNSIGTVDAPTNPPNCRSNGHGEQGMHGTR